MEPARPALRRGPRDGRRAAGSRAAIPELHASATKSLWYRGLIGRAFFDTPTGPEEYAYIPDDLLLLLPPVQSSRNPAAGPPRYPGRRATILLASDRILDDACTLLAALRMGTALPGQAAAPHVKAGKSAPVVQSEVERVDFYALRSNPLLPYPLSAAALQALLGMAGLLDRAGAPLPEPTRPFLEASRGEALLSLVQVWLRGAEFNELRLIPSLVAEGAWRNDPLRARHAILDFLFTIPGALSTGEGQERPFWSLASLIAAVRQTAPDFQRTAGEYDTWFLRHRESGANLRGFENWDAVEGELIRFIVAGPLHWLGIVDLGLPEQTLQKPPSQATAFRFSSWAADLLSLKPPAAWLQKTSPSTPAGMGGCTSRRGRHAPLAIKRPVSPPGSATPRTAITTVSPRLRWRRRSARGCAYRHLAILLRHHAQAVPPGLLQALERWESSGSAARLERALILRVKDPELLQTLRASPLARYFGELLGPAAVIVRPGGVEKLVDGLGGDGLSCRSRSWQAVAGIADPGQSTRRDHRSRLQRMRRALSENKKIAGVILLLSITGFTWLF